MKYLKRFNMIKESKYDNRRFSIVSNRDLKPFIKQCGESLELPDGHFKHTQAIETLKELIEEIQHRIDYEEKTDRTSMEQMTYDLIKEIIEENGELYYSADVLKGIKKIAEDTLSNKKYTE